VKVKVLLNKHGIEKIFKLAEKDPASCDCPLLKEEPEQAYSFLVGDLL